MRITKFTHACVRLEDHGSVLVIDPGSWTEAEAWAGADAVLITHAHSDHIDVGRLAGLGVPIYAPTGANIPLPDVSHVDAGVEFTAAGWRVRTFGGQHATIFGGLPDLPNLGYLVQESLYHPGDSLYVPESPVETLLVPVQASWMKLGEAIDFVKAIRPQRTFQIHDGQVNDRGLAGVNYWLTEHAEGGYRYLAVGESA